MNRREMLKAAFSASTGFAIGGVGKVDIHSSDSWNDVLLVTIELNPNYDFEDGEKDKIRSAIKAYSGRDIPIAFVEGIKINLHTSKGLANVQSEMEALKDQITRIDKTLDSNGIYL